MTLKSEAEIQNAYQSEATAARYIEERFKSELHRLLHNRQVAAVQRVIDRQDARRILEIAPGPGRLTRDIRFPEKLVCLEYNEGMIAQGRPACDPRVVWVHGNAFDLPFSEEFDLIYAFRFIRHFQFADRDRLYAQIRQVLRPGGHFIMDAVNERVARPIRARHPEDYPIYDELYSPEALRAELTKAGFEVLRLDPVQKCFRWQHGSQTLLGPRANRINRLLIGTLERLPFRDGLEWVITCRRA